MKNYNCSTTFRRNLLQQFNQNQSRDTRSIRTSSVTAFSKQSL